MPSFHSIVVSSLVDSSILTNPSPPTSLIALQTISPHEESLLADIQATSLMRLLFKSTGYTTCFNFSTAKDTAKSIPLFKPIGLAPDDKHLIPSLTID